MQNYSHTRTDTIIIGETAGFVGESPESYALFR